MNYLWSVIGVVGSSFCTGLVTWGMLRAQVADILERLKHLEAERDRMIERIHAQRDIYVTQQHFAIIINTIREDQKEMKDDLKKVLDLLSSR